MPQNTKTHPNSTQLRVGRFFALLALLLATSACATAPRTTSTISDPLAPANRVIFAANDGLYRWGFEPVARGWDWLAPDPVQNSVQNGFQNLATPGSALNNLMQGKYKNSGTEFARFGINTTIGVAGLFDPAARFGLAPHPEDFDQTLAVWGVGTGPYLMWPILGPSSPRHTIALGVDSLLSLWPIAASTRVILGVRATDFLNDISLSWEDMRSARESSLDYYVFIRDAWTQNRNSKIFDGNPPSAEFSPTTNEEDFYDDPLAPAH